jgi:hypothetical protein
MKNDFGFPLEDVANDIPQCTALLSSYLNSGYLGLLLGAGVSKDFKLPGWEKLVLDLCKAENPSSIPPKKKQFSTDDLKKLTQQAKDKINDPLRYWETVKEHLYKSVDFDFKLASKDLLIAISSLLVGKKRGNVSNIITYNFDSVLEWYLDIIGLDVNTITKDQLLFRASDVNITHIHGYLPHDLKYGKDSDFLIFSKEEFLDRLLSGTDYWKDHFFEFFRRQIFLTIGMSPSSLEDDVFPYLRQMDIWYEQQKFYRMMPYGIALLTPGVASTDIIDSCIKHGVIPCIVDIPKIPTTIFEICQNALITP